MIIWCRSICNRLQASRWSTAGALVWWMTAPGRCSSIPAGVSGGTAHRRRSHHRSRQGLAWNGCSPPPLLPSPPPPLMGGGAGVGIRPILCRQGRVGVGIADGFTRITNGKRIGVFAMQYGPGAEKAFPGVATGYSDSVPMLVLPRGHQRDRAQVFPLFSSARAYDSVTKWVETLNQPEQVSEVMRRAFNLLKMGRPGPVMVEIRADVALAEVDAAIVQAYKVVKPTC